MRKYLAIIEGRSIKKYNLSKIISPMTVVRKHLYRTDEQLFHLEKGGGDAIEFVDLESTQAYGDGMTYSDPDETIAVLDTAPNLKGKVAVWNKLTDGGGMQIMYIAFALIAVIFVIGKMLS